MNSKTMYILVAVLVIVIVVAGIGIYLYMGTGGGGGGGGGVENTYTVSNATSLQYSVDVTATGTTGTYKFWGKNVGTANLLLRVDVAGAGTTYSYILNATAEKSWTNQTGTWAEGDFTTDWASWGGQWTGYIDALKSWSGTGDYSYTATDGSAIKIYDISINPSLPDSLFQAS